MRLEEHSLTPLYRQVMDGIREAIGSGRYVPGDKIPSEAELSELYSVSRITIRRAIEELAAEGLLTKKQGKGTYVNPPKLTHKIIQRSAVQDFWHTCVLSDRMPSVELLACERVAAWADAAAFLGVAPGDELLHVRGLWKADDVPVMLEDDYLSLGEFGILEHEDLGAGSLFDLMERACGRRPTSSGGCLIEIVRALPEVACLLGISAGEPLFHAATDLLDAEGRPVMVCRAVLVGDLYAFDVG